MPLSQRRHADAEAMLLEELAGKGADLWFILHKQNRFGIDSHDEAPRDASL